jgi:formylglycine-generating enzyme required for sulfatase activity
MPWLAQPAYGSAPAINGDSLTADLGGGVSLAMVRVRAGSFAMGSPAGESGRAHDEGPQTYVSIPRDFWMAEEEATVGQFRQFVAETGYRTEAELRGDGATWDSPGFTQGSDYPVVCVSWNDASAFCAWLSGKTSLAVSLPTEAQWEYAARAGTSSPFIWGASVEHGERLANGVDEDASSGGRMKSFMFNPMSGGKGGVSDGFAKTAPGFRFQPNAWGLRNMSGNAAEWCFDWHANYPGGSATDPIGPSSGYERVVRGGSWATARKNLRVAARERFRPDASSNQIGFRVAAPAY